MAALSDAAVDVGEELCHSQTREELSAKILQLSPDELMAESFKEHAGIMAKAAENIVDYVGFSGEHVKNYACLYLAVEEKVRSTLWHSLPSRWMIMKEIRLINHYHTYITCTNKKASWTISTGKGENFKIHHYTTRKQKSTI